MIYYKDIFSFAILSLVSSVLNLSRERRAIRIPFINGSLWRRNHEEKPNHRYRNTFFLLVYLRLREPRIYLGKKPEKGGDRMYNNRDLPLLPRPALLPDGRVIAPAAAIIARDLAEITHRLFLAATSGARLPMYVYAYTHRYKCWRITKHFTSSRFHARRGLRSASRELILSWFIEGETFSKTSRRMILNALGIF